MNPNHSAVQGCNLRREASGAVNSDIHAWGGFMIPTIVPVYAAVLAFIYIVLSARVIQARRNAKADGRHGDDICCHCRNGLVAPYASVWAFVAVMH